MFGFFEDDFLKQNKITFFVLQVDKEGQESISVRDLLLELRRYRLGLIQTYGQLFFSYKAIIEGIQHFNDPVR